MEIDVISPDVESGRKKVYNILCNFITLLLIWVAVYKDCSSFGKKLNLYILPPIGWHEHNAIWEGATVRRLLDSSTETDKGELNSQIASVSNSKEVDTWTNPWSFQAVIINLNPLLVSPQPQLISYSIRFSVLFWSSTTWLVPATELQSWEPVIEDESYSTPGSRKHLDGLERELREWGGGKSKYEILLGV